MNHKIKAIVVLMMLSLIFSSCNLLKGEIPPGTSAVRGYVRDDEGAGLSELGVSLAGETVTTGEDGAFEFNDVNNGSYTLRVIEDGKTIQEISLIVKADIVDLVVTIDKNLIDHGGFEGLSLGALPRGPWDLTIFREGAPTTVEIVGDFARSGTNSARISGEKKDNVIPRASVKRYVSLEGGATYRLSAWFYTSSEVTKPASHPILMRLRFYDKGKDTNFPIKDQVDSMILAPSKTHYRTSGDNFVLIDPLEHIDGQWNELFVEFKAPTGTDRMFLELFYEKIWNDDDAGTLWWDDVSMVRID